MGELKVFENQDFGSIRVLDVGGKEMFVASDVARALGYAIPSKAVNTHCKGVSKTEVPTKGGAQEMLVISEGDLYRLIVHSKLPTAEKFESWVFDEVLPTIRKHGAYMTENVLEKAIANPDFMIGLLQNLKEEKIARLEAERKNAVLMHVNKTYTATEIAKEIGFKSAIALNKDLHEKKIQFYSNGTWVMYSKYAEMGLTSIKQTVLDNGVVKYDRRWTQDGRKFLLDLYDVA